MILILKIIISILLIENYELTNSALELWPSRVGQLKQNEIEVIEEKILYTKTFMENLKDVFIKENKLPSNCKLRLFFSGMEIKDEHYLYQHKLKNDFKIQVMKMN